jgi:hypothetical protein
VKESSSAGKSYQIRGGFGSWLRQKFPHCQYRFATAEFGTYSAMRVIRALTDELHWHTQLGHSQPDHWARRALTEAFAPQDQRWRGVSVAAGLSLVERAAEALWTSGTSPRRSLITP